jgi:hypothetical protein
MIRLRKSMLYPLSYGRGTSARTSAKGSACKSPPSLGPSLPESKLGHNETPGQT